MYLLILSTWELFALIIVFAGLLFMAIRPYWKQQKKAPQKPVKRSDDSDIYYDLWFQELKGNAVARYNAYVKWGNADRLPDRNTAIVKDRIMQQKLSQVSDDKEKKAILHEYMPDIMLSLYV